MYGINNFLLLAIPLFILAARLMNTSGVTTRLFNFATTMVGFLPGGLGHANCVASLIFAGMSGAAVADAVPEVRAAAHWVTTLPGGQGAVREVCDLLLKAQGRWEELVRPWQGPAAG